MSNERNTWTKEMEETLKRDYPSKRTYLIAQEFGKTTKAVATRAKMLGLLKAKGYKRISERAFWTPEKEAKLIELFPHHPESYLSKALECTIGQLGNRAHKLKLKKSADYVVTTCFSKGHTPANKGTKGLSSANSGSFKKGQVPPNTKSDGVITLRGGTRHGKNQPKYKYIRLSKGKWKEYHKYLWEQAYGTVPKGMVIYFKDGNQMNCVLENLGCKSQKENMLTNHLSDGTISKTLATISGGRGKIDYELREELLRHPEIIEAKRKQLLLNRLINQNGQEI